MNYTVIIKDYAVPEVLNIVHELVKLYNLKLNEDFEFYYHPPEYDFMNSHNNVSKHTTFKFKDGKIATFVQLKYGV